MYYIGIDLGTSAVKLLLMDENGAIRNTVSKEYPLYFPQPGWSEQRPEDWYEQTAAGLYELLDGFDRPLHIQQTINQSLFSTQRMNFRQRYTGNFLTYQTVNENQISILHIILFGIIIDKSNDCCQGQTDC